MYVFKPLLYKYTRRIKYPGTLWFILCRDKLSRHWSNIDPLKTPNTNRPMFYVLPFYEYLIIIVVFFGVFECITLQYKHNMHTLSGNITFICTRLQTGKTSSLKVHILLRREVWAHKTSASFYWSACTKPGEWTIMYVCALWYRFGLSRDFDI